MRRDSSRSSRWGRVSLPVLACLYIAPLHQNITWAHGFDYIGMFDVQEAGRHTLKFSSPSGEGFGTEGESMGLMVVPAPSADFEGLDEAETDSEAGS